MDSVSVTTEYHRVHSTLYVVFEHLEILHICDHTPSKPESKLVKPHKATDRSFLSIGKYCRV